MRFTLGRYKMKVGKIDARELFHLFGIAYRCVTQDLKLKTPTTKTEKKKHHWPETETGWI